MCLVWDFLFVFYFGSGLQQTVGQEESLFSYWKEPPIDSSNGEGNASVIVKENSIVGTSTGIKLEAIGGEGRIIYIFEKSTTYLEIKGQDRNEIFIKSPIDFEQMENIKIRVIAYDEGSPKKTGTADMTVFIGDVNDNEPIFQQSNYEVKISPLLDIGKQPFVKTLASDSDGSSPNNNVKYTIAAGNKNGSFVIDEKSGDIMIARQLMGYNAIPEYELIVIGVDGGSDPGPLTGTTTVVVKTIDIETFDNWKKPPIQSGFGSGIAFKKVKENEEIGTITDIDLQAVGGQGSVIYTIKNDQQTIGIGGPSNNTIVVTGPIDFEAYPSISILVEARDSSMTTKIGRANMTILIEDINDNAPIFKESQYQLFVSENKEIGYEVGVITAVDNDGTSPNNKITYSLSDGNTNSAFAIDPPTGAIKIFKDLRVESTSTYKLQVLAIDGGVTPGPLTGSTMVTIKVEKDAADVTSAAPESTTQQASTPMLAGTSILTPCLFTMFLHGTLLTVY